MVFGRQDLLREAAALVARARLEEDSQKAADLLKQAADILETVAELLAHDDPDVRPKSHLTCQGLESRGFAFALGMARAESGRGTAPTDFGPAAGTVLPSRCPHIPSAAL